MSGDPASERPLDGIALYLREIGSRRLLDASEEVALAKRSERGDDAARRRLIESNLRLVVAIARTYRGTRLPLFDLIQEGTLGLIRAVDKFDWRRGTRFATYAGYWIRAGIEQSIAANAEPIRVPIRVQRRVRLLDTFAREHRARLGRAPSLEEIAEGTGTSIEKAAELLALRRDYRSLDAPHGPSGDGPVADFISADDSGADFDHADSALTAPWIRTLVDSLPEAERRIIDLRFGFQGGAQPVNRVAIALALSPDRVRSLEARALARLRHAGGKALAEERSPVTQSVRAATAASLLADRLAA